MKTDSEHPVAWLSFAVLLAFTAFYPAFRGLDTEFYDDIVGQLIATAFALIAGIPAGLYLDRVAKSRAEKTRKEQRRQDEKHLLIFLRNELGADKYLVDERITTPGRIPEAWMNLSYWQAAKDSGLLNLIDDVGLLSHLTNAYYGIEAGRTKEELAYEVSLTSANLRIGGKTPAMIATDVLDTHYKAIQPRLNEAIEAIDQNLNRD